MVAPEPTVQSQNRSRSWLPHPAQGSGWVVPLRGGDGDFRRRVGLERPLRPPCLSHHLKGTPREVKGLTGVTQKWGHPSGTEDGGLEAVYMPDLVSPFFPGPRAGWAAGQALPAGSGGRGQRKQRPHCAAVPPFALGCDGRSGLGSSLHRGLTVGVCKPQLLSTRILETSMWLPPFLSLFSPLLCPGGQNGKVGGVNPRNASPYGWWKSLMSPAHGNRHATESQPAGA